MAIDLGKIGQTLKGVYNPSSVYEKLDLVTSNGNSYISKINNNNLPLTDISAWQLNASKGDTGEKGDKGDKGDIGIKGDTGATGSNAQSFNFKGNVTTYSNLPTTGMVSNDGYFNEADNKIYVYNGTSFPANGAGISVGEVPSTLRTWGLSDVGLVQGSTRLRNNNQYVVKTGQTSTSLPPELDSAVWELISINWDSPYKDILNPTLEVGALALSGSIGSPTASTTRGRTPSFLDIAYAVQLELIGDMRIQNIFYYDASNVYISTQAINAKVFTPTIPPTATKFKLSLFHVVNTQTVTQAELDALTLNCFSNNSVTLRDVIEDSKKSTIVANDYDSFIINLGEGAYKELGGINVADGSDANNNIRIRTERIKLSNGNYTITQDSGYVLSRVVKYKDGAFVSWASLPDFSIDINVADEVRLVWSKTVATDTITQGEVDVFNFSIQDLSANKFQQLQDQINQSELDTTSWFTNKKMSSIGDSITYGFIPRNYTGYPGQLDSFAKQAATLLNMNWENKGISGSTLGQLSSSDTTTRDPMINRYSSMASDAKVITFMGGTNDLRNISNLGVMTDRIPQTYYGALHILIQGLLNKYIYFQNLILAKDILIVGITPIKIYPDSTYNNFKMIDYVNAMKEVCAYYSIPCFDAYNLSGLTPSEFRTLQGTEPGYTDMYNTLITDGIHPTKEGDAIFAQRFVGFLKSLVV